MKKIIILLITAIMLVLSGCQGNNSSQSKNVNDSAQTGSSTLAAADTTAANNNSTQSTNSSKNNNTASAANTASSDKKNQTSTTQTAAKPKVEQKKPESVFFTLLITKNRGTKEILTKKIQIKDNKCLMDYLRENVKLVEDGGFIKSIEGLESVPSSKLTSEQKKAGIMGVDWFLFQNKVKAKSGANDIIPKNGDTINADYREWTYKDIAP